MNKLFLIIVVCLGVSFNSKADDKTKRFKTLEEAKLFSKKICDLIYRDSITSAFEQIRNYWSLPEDEMFELEDGTEKQLGAGNNSFGAKIEIVKIGEETIKDFAVKETYFIRYDRNAIRFIFRYYKSNNGWMLSSFKWDDKFPSEFK